MPAAPHVLFAGGPTDDSLLPGLAVAEHLYQRLPQGAITFAGSDSSRNSHVVRSAGYHYSMIPTRSFPQNPLHLLRYLTDNLAGHCAARWMLREQQISLVVGLGGSTSDAVVRAASARGIPVILLEQNSLPSRTTRRLSRSAALVCAAFDQVRPHLHVQANVRVTGSPTRPALEQLFRRRDQANGNSTTNAPTDILPLPVGDSRREKSLVILGDSGDAQLLNTTLPGALGQLKESLAGWQIVHQAGPGQLQQTQRRYQQRGISALAVTTIDQLASVLFASDLVVCRAGGTILSELALAGVSAVLLPSMQPTEQAQTANAKIVAAAGGCRWIDQTAQSDQFVTALAHELRPLLLDDPLRHEMARKMHALARPYAPAEIAAAIHDILRGGQVASRAAA